METFEIYEIEDLKAEKSKEDRTITHYISTPDVDRGKDIVNPRGMDSSDFEKTGTVFYNHNYDYPIAKNLWIKRTEHGVKAKTQFSESSRANDIYLLHMEDIIRTWSIGFDVPRKGGRWGDPVEGAMTRDEGTGIRTINKWILLEYSSAPLAMNPNALDLAKNIKSYLKTDEIKKVIENFETTEEIKLILNEQKKEIETLKEYIKLNDNSELKNEIAELKNTLLKNTRESLEYQPKKISDKEIVEMILGGLSRKLGVRN